MRDCSFDATLDKQLQSYWYDCMSSDAEKRRCTYQRTLELPRGDEESTGLM